MFSQILCGFDRLEEAASLGTFERQEVASSMLKMRLGRVTVRFENDVEVPVLRNFSVGW